MCESQEQDAAPTYPWQVQDNPFDKEWSKNPPADSAVSEQGQSGTAVEKGGTHMQLSKEFQRFQQYPNTAAAPGGSAVPEDCNRQGPAQASSNVATTIQDDLPAAGEVASASQSEPVEAPNSLQLQEPQRQQQRLQLWQKQWPARASWPACSSGPGASQPAPIRSERLEQCLFVLQKKAPSRQGSQIQRDFEVTGVAVTCALSN